MQIKTLTASFGRRGPAGHGASRMLADAEAPAASAPVDPCSVKSWYDDVPVDAEGKPTPPMISTAASVVLTSLGLGAVGGAGAAVALPKHRVIGGVVGALTGMLVGAAISGARYTAWKDAGGQSHEKGACAPVPAPTPAAPTP